uniref:Uncharacterized protein n=1 Tax=Ascaris lumbricoides TaxID=6252 RepID=A0A0M3IWJ5_ASCLU
MSNVNDMEIGCPFSNSNSCKCSGFKPYPWRLTIFLHNFIECFCRIMFASGVN